MFSKGVFPVHGIDIKVSTKGVTELESDMVTIAELETFSISVDGVVQEWSPLEQKGWKRRLMTGKSISVTCNGKRNVGDPGNDYIAGLMDKTGQEATTTFSITFPNGDIFKMNCVIDIKEYIGGESTDVAPLSFDALSDGKPSYQPKSA